MVCDLCADSRNEARSSYNLTGARHERPVGWGSKRVRSSVPVENPRG